MSLDSMARLGPGCRDRVCPGCGKPARGVDHVLHGVVYARKSGHICPHSNDTLWHLSCLPSKPKGECCFWCRKR